MLLRADCTVVGRGSSHRTFAHPLVPERHLTLVDRGHGDVKVVYIRHSERLLRAIAGRL